MIVVSDNGPISFLVLIGEVELLPRLYAEVLLPPCVLRELRHPNTPLLVRNWLGTNPSWLYEQTPIANFSPERAGAGERQAIQLAKELGALLLCDDRDAVKMARREGLTVTGTLGVLQLGHERGFVDITDEIERLRAFTTLYLPEELLPRIVAIAEQRLRERIVREGSDDEDKP